MKTRNDMKNPWGFWYLFLVGGFNPVQKILVKMIQNGHLPQVGVNMKNI